METICATGIRVSEVPYITTDAIKKGRARISMKGKLRTILIPAQLCRKLRKYATKHRIGRGEIFLTKNGTRLERKQIWAQMKALCKYAGIERNKVFPRQSQTSVRQMLLPDLSRHFLAGGRVWDTAVSKPPGSI